MSLQSLHSIVQPGERGLLESIFVGYVQLTAESPYPIIVYSVANYRPHLRDTSQVTVSLLPRISRSEFCYPNNPEKGRRRGEYFWLLKMEPHYSQSKSWKCDPIQQHISSSLLRGSIPFGCPSWGDVLYGWPLSSYTKSKGYSLYPTRRHLSLQLCLIMDSLGGVSLQACRASR